ncbi:hypothetical protein Tco_0401470, partial [Tanacetum coccineum]
MASLNFRLNPIYPIKEYSSCGALYNKSRGCSKGGFVDKFVRDPNETPDSSQRPPHNYPKCENPIDDFLNTSEPSNDNTNVVNAPQEPFVFNQDPGENSSQSPPHIDHHCCYGCGDSLDGIFCQRCTCESCGNGAHYGYNCPPKVLIISNPEPCYNQNVDEFPQTLPSFHLSCYSGDENSFTYDSKLNFVDDSPNPPPQPPTYSYEFCGNDAHYGHDCPPQVPFIYNPEPCYNQDFNFPQNFQKKQHQPEDIQELLRKLLNDVQIISEELTDFINTPNWNRLAFYHYEISKLPPCIAITPVLSTEKPVDSLIMEDEHLDTIPARELDEVIKSSVEDLVPIPSESEGIPDNMCDVPFRDNSPPLDISKDQFEDFSDSNNDSTSTDDGSFSIDNIDYVEASPPNSELVSLKDVKNFDPEDGVIDTDILLTIKDDILREKLLNINIFIAKIEALKDNPTPSTDFVLKSPSLFPYSFLEETDTSDNSLPESEIFCFNLEDKSSGNPTSYTDLSLPDYEAFFCDSEPDSEGFYYGCVSFPSGTRNKIFDPGIFIGVQSKRFLSPNEFSISFICDPLSPVFDTLLPFSSENEEKNFNPGSLSSNEAKSPLFAYVVWIFLPFLTYPVAPPYLLSSGNEDTIFDPGISIYHSFMSGVSHRSGTFMKFNVYPNHLNESPMEILSSTCFPMDNEFEDCPDFAASRARGFVLRSQEL